MLAFETLNWDPADMWRDTTFADHRKTAGPLLETSIRSLLGVALFAAYPAFSDIYRLWRRDAGVVRLQLGPGEFEYPPVAALLWRPLSGLPSARIAVVVNGLLMVGAAVAITWLIMRSVKERRSADIELWTKSSALIFLLAINWDVAAALMAVWAVSMLYRDRMEVSGATLGIGTALKVFPGASVPLLLALLVGWRKRIRFLTALVAVIGLAYTVYALVEPDGWNLHLQFASERDDYQTTIWMPIVSGLKALGLSLTLGQLNVMATIFGGVALVSAGVWSVRHRPTLGEAATLGTTVFLLVNKTFKPQYALWVLPLFALISLRRRTARTLEFGVLVEFFAIFFSLPWAVAGIGALARTSALLVGLREILQRSDGSRIDYVPTG